MIPNKYRHIKTISYGGRVIIELYQDTERDIPVVIKQCNPEASPAAQERFCREARIMKHIQHPQLVNYYEFLDNPPSIVMEYLEGGNLQEKIKNQGKIAWPDALDIVTQVADGLDALHARQILHRDIKPANILFSKDGKIKLSDFGFAKTGALFTRQITRGGQRPGTILYSPPEMWSPDAGDSGFNPRQDIYSLGVTFYEMITGRHPFAGDGKVSMFDLMASTMKGDYPPPSRFVAELPDEIEAVVARMMAREPQDRYVSAAELIGEVGTCKNDLVAIKTRLGSNDPLQSLKLLDVGHVRWPQEEAIVAATSEQMTAFADVATALKLLPKLRKKIALSYLLPFAIRHGRWQDACQFSSQMYETSDIAVRHLQYVAKRIEGQGAIVKDWYNAGRDTVRSRVWSEKEFVCKKCKTAMNESDIAQNRIFFLPDVFCQKCLPEAATAKFELFERELIQLPGEKDTLGDYFVAIADNSVPALVHRVSWARNKLPDLAAKKIIERYKRGIQVAANLQGAPWLLSISNYCPVEDGAYTYFFLDYRPSRPLKNFRLNLPSAQKKSFSLAKAYILVELLRGLELLHAAGAVHRYISPHNAYIDLQGQVWLGGFSLAKFDNNIQDDDWVAMTMDLSGVRVGNPYYMAPEQFKGMKYADHRSDLWSFAALAYQLLTGEALFKEEKGDILQARQARLAYTPICEIAQNTPEKFATMIEKCLSEDPERRYQDASALLRDMAKELREFNDLVQKQK
jgi:serine/threonine protein kinase